MVAGKQLAWPTPVWRPHGHGHCSVPRGAQQVLCSCLLGPGKGSALLTASWLGRGGCRGLETPLEAFHSRHVRPRPAPPRSGVSPRQLPFCCSPAPAGPEEDFSPAAAWTTTVPKQEETQGAYWVQLQAGRHSAGRVPRHPVRRRSMGWAMAGQGWYGTRLPCLCENTQGQGRLDPQWRWTGVFVTSGPLLWPLSTIN